MNCQKAGGICDNMSADITSLFFFVVRHNDDTLQLESRGTA